MTHTTTIRGTSGPARSRRMLLALAAMLATALGTAAIAAPAAQAWYYGNAYLVVNNWRCVGGGNVTGIFGAVDNAWSGGDWGNNIIYARVRIGDTNTFNGWAHCNRPWWRLGPYRINVTWWQFRPTGNNQTFWY